MICGVHIGRCYAALKMGRRCVQRVVHGICARICWLTDMAIGLAARAVRILYAAWRKTRRRSHDATRAAIAWLLRGRMRLPCSNAFARWLALAVAQAAVIFGAFTLGVALRVATIGQ